MALDADAWKLVHDALREAFPTWDDLDLMVAKGLGKNLHEIATDQKNLNAAVTALLRQADAEGHVPDLLRAAHDERPHNDKLVAAVRAYAAPSLRFRGATLLPAPPPPEPPRRPYPLLEAYSYPPAFTGRERELGEALDKLHARRLLLCIHAASGAGKSSFLQAGLVPRLRSDGVPVALNREPDEPGIARRLTAKLLDLPDGSRLPDHDLAGFVHLLDLCASLAHKTPVIVLDQFEDAFRRSEDGEALARLGPLLAASTELDAPDGYGFRCRWVLSYRQEFHGKVVEWLRDVLSDARARGRSGLENLPHDLHREKYFSEMPIAPLGAVVSREDAKSVFLDAIAKPLDLVDADGKKGYLYRFEDGAAERLAGAFADTRLERPRAPLLPELQVVLDQRLREAKTAADGVAVVTVPDDVRGMVDNALARHLEEALRAFSGIDAKRLRAVALLALRELADAEGKRGKGIAPEELEKRLGAKHEAVLSVLQDKRLVVRDAGEHDADGGDWVLPHDQMAAVIVALLGDAEKRKQYEIDEEVIELQQKVRLRMEMHRHGEAEGVSLPEKLFKRVQATRGSLLWDEECEAWWQACVEWRRRKRAARLLLALCVGMTSVALILGTTFYLWFVVWPKGAIVRIDTAQDVAEARAALHDLSWYPGWARAEGQRSFDARMRDWANRLIERSRERAQKQAFKEALRLRLQAAVSYDAKTDENMREAAYLASLFAGGERAEPPIPSDVKWVPNGRLPRASATGFVGDYVLEPPSQLWSTRTQTKKTVAFTPEEADAWNLVESRLFQRFGFSKKSFSDAELRQVREIVGEVREPVVARCLRTALSQSHFFLFYVMKKCLAQSHGFAIVRTERGEDVLLHFEAGGPREHFESLRMRHVGDPPAERGRGTDELPSDIECYAFSDDASLALCSGGPGGLYVENLSKRSLEKKLSDDLGGVIDASFSRDKSRVAIRKVDTFAVYDTATGHQALLSSLGGTPAGVRLSPSGKVVFVAGLGFVDVDRGDDRCAKANIFGLGIFGGEIDMDPQDRLAIVRTEERRVELWKIDGACERLWSMDVNVSAAYGPKTRAYVQFSQDGKRAVVVDDENVYFLDVTDDGLKPYSTRLIYGDWSAVQALPDGSAVEAIVRGKEDKGVGLQTLKRDLAGEVPRIEDPNGALEFWQQKSGP